MLAKISFHILTSETSPKARELHCCKLIAADYDSDAKSRIYVHTATSEESKNLDLLLWTFSDISFIPHGIYDPQKPEATIVIGNDDHLQITGNTLINLSNRLPPFYQNFNHLIEIIAHDEEMKSLARSRFRNYQKNGYTLETFMI